MSDMLDFHDLSPLPGTSYRDITSHTPGGRRAPGPALVEAHILTPTGELTIAGALAFGRLGERCPSCLLVQEHRYTTGRAEILDGAHVTTCPTTHTGPMPELLSDLAGSLVQVLAPRHADAKQAEVLARELLVNALGHRAFEPAHLDQPVKIDIFTDQVRIMSPGGLHQDVKLVKHSLHGRRSRNPTLMGFLTDLGLARQEGTGLAWAQDLARELGYTLHHIATDDAVVTTLSIDPKRRVRAARMDALRDPRKRLQPDSVDQMVLDCLNQDRYRSAKELVTTLGRSRGTIRNALERLEERDLIERRHESRRSPHQGYKLKG